MRSKNKKTVASDDYIVRTLESFKERFGIDPEFFKQYHLFSRKNDVWCCTSQAGELKINNVIRRGLRIARAFDFTVKPTTNAVQLFGHMATRNRLNLDQVQTENFLAGQTQEVEVPDQVTDGFVIAFFSDFALGIGLLKGNTLKSQVPRSRRIVG